MTTMRPPASRAAARIRDFGTTVFTRMNELAKLDGVLNLGQGAPDSPGPSAVLTAAAMAVRAGRNQYPPANGLPELRLAVAEQRDARYGTGYDPDMEVLITNGATEAISAALLALCEPGDEVVLFEPYYDSYAAAIALAGGVRKPVLLPVSGDRFTFDEQRLRDAVGARTRFLVLNSPHNPTGKVFTRAELAVIAEIARAHDLVVLTDEVYEYLTYDDAVHHSIAALPGMRDHTLVVSSAGKTFNVTGWKVGWACGPADVVAAVRAVKQYLTFGGGTPFQEAVAVGLRDGGTWFDDLRTDLRRRRDLLASGLLASGFRVYATEGGYFTQVDARSFGYRDGTQLCHELPRLAGVVAVPSSAFYDTPHAGRHLVRLAFCKRESLLAQAVERLSALPAVSADDWN